MVGRSKVGSRRHVLDPLFVSSPPGREKSSNLSFSPRAAPATEKFNFELFVPPGGGGEKFNFELFASLCRVLLSRQIVRPFKKYLTFSLSPHPLSLPSSGQASSGPTNWLVRPRAAQPIGWSGHERPNQSAGHATSGPTNRLVWPRAAQPIG